MKKITDKKGFTLIELLAAVVILGILMLVAIPRVSKYIEDAKKDAFIDTAKAYVEAARNAVANGEFVCNDGGVIVFTDLSVDKGTKSSYGKNIDRGTSFVKINYDSDGNYIYSVYMVDEKHAIAPSSSYASNSWSSDEYHAAPADSLDRAYLYDINSYTSYSVYTTCSKLG